MAVRHGRPRLRGDPQVALAAGQGRRPREPVARLALPSIYRLGPLPEPRGLAAPLPRPSRLRV
ncbi:MAG: hypothetical protein LBP92_09205 [Deltaproteobacteria bacterium]|jgi:hypothetical protein|nr:hypothetical protein [Deltaproteobacteria bacterium]